MPLGTAPPKLWIFCSFTFRKINIRRDIPCNIPGRTFKGCYDGDSESELIPLMLWHATMIIHRIPYGWWTKGSFFRYQRNNPSILNSLSLQPGSWHPINIYSNRLKNFLGDSKNKRIQAISNQSLPQTASLSSRKTPKDASISSKVLTSKHEEEHPSSEPRKEGVVHRSRQGVAHQRKKNPHSTWNRAPQWNKG